MQTVTHARLFRYIPPILTRQAFYVHFTPWHRQTSCVICLIDCGFIRIRHFHIQKGKHTDKTLTHLQHTSFLRLAQLRVSFRLQPVHQDIHRHTIPKWVTFARRRVHGQELRPELRAALSWKISRYVRFQVGDGYCVFFLIDPLIKIKLMRLNKHL